MELWDLVFKKYHDPTFFLDTVIDNGQFVEFLDTLEKKRIEEQRWEFYLHKLSFMDDRTWEEFNHDLDFGTDKGLERPSDEDLTNIVRDSYNIMKNFNPEEEGGE